MQEKDDLNYLQERFAALPEVMLPDSLRAEALFAKLDAEPEVPSQKPKRAAVVEFVHRYRAVLSYAAAFALLVLVYYGVGLDQSLTPAPMAAPQQMMAAPASSSMAAAAAAAEPAANEFAVPMAADSADLPETEQEKTAGDVDGGTGAAAEPSAAPRLMSGPQPLTELQLQNASVRLEELGGAVQLVVRCADSTDRIFTQQGGYLYLGELEGVPDRLLLATLTDAGQVPQTGSDSLSEPVAAASISSYPGDKLDQYMVLTVLDAATGTALRETAAVLGSRLILQPLGEGSYVVFSDTQPDARAIASLELGGATIELR